MKEFSSRGKATWNKVFFRTFPPMYTSKSSRKRNRSVVPSELLLHMCVECQALIRLLWQAPFPPYQYLNLNAFCAVFFELPHCIKLVIARTPRGALRRLKASLAETAERHRHHSEAVSSHTKTRAELHHYGRNCKDFGGVHNGEATFTFAYKSVLYTCRVQLRPAIKKRQFGVDAQCLTL